MRRICLVGLSALSLYLTTACQKYMAIPNSAADRMWMITEDRTEVFRCWDLKNQTGKLMAICRRAEHLGKGEKTIMSDFADSTNPPAHPDSTEMCPGSTVPQAIEQSPMKR